MKKIIFLSVFLSAVCCQQFANAQRHKYPVTVPNPYTAYFAEAYQKYPGIPQGMLEAVAFTHTRFHQLTHNPGDPQSCMGMPYYYGVMGLVLDGKNYFHNNLLLVAQLSGYSAEQIMNSPEISILAYAAAYSKEKQMLFVTGNAIEEQVPVLRALSELPDSTQGQQYAQNADIYEMLNFLNNPAFQRTYKFPHYIIDMKKVFGEEGYKILSSPYNTIENGKINGGTGFLDNSHRAHRATAGADYSGAIWNPAATCNYTVGRTMAITAVVIHDMEGSYAGSISWFQNCSSQVSAHYCIRSSDGQITQMVHEADKAWHVGSENGYTIGIEHEGYQNQTGWYTDPMYYASAELVKKHICPAYGILSTRMAWWPWAATTDYATASIPGSCTYIKGHQHYPNQTHTDPGQNWDWDYYYKLVNDTNVKYTYYTADTGSFYDDGGAAANYNNDERSLYVIAPKGSKTVTVNFSSFSTENTWDYLYIYDGGDVWAPLIGYYTGTTSPGTITSTGDSLCFEFRSDCATTSTGWAAKWTANGIPTGIASNMGNNAVNVYPNPFSENITVSGVPGNADVLLYDMLGRKVQEFRNTNTVSHSAVLDTQSLPKGVYFLKVTGAELSYTAKVVKG